MTSSVFILSEKKAVSSINAFNRLIMITNLMGKFFAVDMVNPPVPLDRRVIAR